MTDAEMKEEKKHKKKFDEKCYPQFDTTVDTAVPHFDIRECEERECTNLEFNDLLHICKEINFCKLEENYDTEHCNHERHFKAQNAFDKLCYNYQEPVTTTTPIHFDPSECEERECENPKFHLLQVCVEKNFCKTSGNETTQRCLDEMKQKLYMMLNRLCDPTQFKTGTSTTTFNHADCEKRECKQNPELQNLDVCKEHNFCDNRETFMNERCIQERRHKAEEKMYQECWGQYNSEGTGSTKLPVMIDIIRCQEKMCTLKELHVLDICQQINKCKDAANKDDESCVMQRKHKSEAHIQNKCKHIILKEEDSTTKKKCDQEDKQEEFDNCQRKACQDPEFSNAFRCEEIQKNTSRKDQKKFEGESKEKREQKHVKKIVKDQKQGKSEGKKIDVEKREQKNGEKREREQKIDVEKREQKNGEKREREQKKEQKNAEKREREQKIDVEKREPKNGEKRQRDQKKEQKREREQKFDGEKREQKDTDNTINAKTTTTKKIKK